MHDDFTPIDSRTTHPKELDLGIQARLTLPKVLHERCGTRNSKHLHTNMFISSNYELHVYTFQTLNRTRNLEVTGCEDNAPALNADAHTGEHLELEVYFG